MYGDKKSVNSLNKVIKISKISKFKRAKIIYLSLLEAKKMLDGGETQ